MAFEDDFESDDSDDVRQKRRAGRSQSERKAEEEQQAGAEKEAAHGRPGISPADQRKYIKAFAKWQRVSVAVGGERPICLHS